MVNFVRKFIPNLAGTLAPLVALTKKEAVKEVAKRWNSEHDQAYAKVKQLLTQAPVLPVSYTHLTLPTIYSV